MKNISILKKKLFLFPISYKKTATITYLQQKLNYKLTTINNKINKHILLQLIHLIHYIRKSVVLPGNEHFSNSVLMAAINGTAGSLALNRPSANI